MLEKTEGAIKIDNPEKMTTRGTQDEEIQNKNTTQYVLDTPMRKRVTLLKTIVHYPSIKLA